MINRIGILLYRGTVPLFAMRTARPVQARGMLVAGHVDRVEMAHGKDNPVC